MNSSTKALPMTKDETMLLVQLIAANPVVNNKATNATNNKMKEEAWQSLSDEFNSSVSSFPRTPAQLRLKWENLKKSARKRSASIRSSQNKGYDKLPVCMAKTSNSLTGDPAVKGAPTGFTLRVNDMFVSVGAGFVVPMVGEISKMPGLPTRPNIYDIDLDTATGEIQGLF